MDSRFRNIAGDGAMRAPLASTLNQQKNVVQQHPLTVLFPHMGASDFGLDSAFFEGTADGEYHFLDQMMQSRQTRCELYKNLAQTAPRPQMGAAFCMVL